MTPLEMHIGVNLEYQKINSNIISSVKPEEMDVLLNNEVLRFIFDKSKPFQEDTEGLEDLEALIESAPLPVYTRDSNSVFTYIPGKVLKLINSKSSTKDLCEAAYAPTVGDSIIHYYPFTLKNTGTADFVDFTFKIDGVTIFTTTNHPKFSAGIPEAEAKFELIDYMLEAIRDAGFDCKYENHIGKHYRESIIIVHTSAFIITADYDGAIEILNSTTLVKSKITAIAGTKDYKNRLTPAHKIDDLLNSAFGTTKFDSPLSTREFGKLNIFHNQKFIVSAVSLNFIRIPRKISLPLNQSCDLNEAVHQQIVSNLAKRLAAVTSAENYQQLLRENIIQK